MKFNFTIARAAALFASMSVATFAAQKQNDTALLQVRETVWRDWFDGDSRTLEKLVPSETIVISGGEEKWKKQTDVIQSAAEFHADGRVTEVFVWRHRKWSNPGWHTDSTK